LKNTVVELKEETKMKVSEYIRRKNDIIEKTTGLVLVPDDQIIDLEPMPLDVYEDGEACPYCIAFEDCKGCPMKLAGNCCNGIEESTYRQVYKALSGGIVQSPLVKKDIRDLVKEYNESNGF